MLAFALTTRIKGALESLYTAYLWSYTNYVSLQKNHSFYSVYIVLATGLLRFTKELLFNFCNFY